MADATPGSVTLGGPPTSSVSDHVLLKAVLQGAAYAALTAVIAAILPLLLKVDHHPYHLEPKEWHKLLFILGVLACVWAQTTVAAFFTLSKAYRGLIIPALKSIELFSNNLLSILAIISIVTIHDFWIHVWSAWLFILLVAFLDVYVGFHSRKSQLESGQKLSRMCTALVLKIDGVSLFGLLALFLIAYVISLNPPIEIAGHITRTQAAETFIEIFISGAVGFHFFVITWLLFVHLSEWNDDLSGNRGRPKLLLINLANSARRFLMPKRLGRLAVGIGATAAIALVAIFIAQKISNTGLQANPDTTIGVATWPGFAPPFVADKRGYFKPSHVAIDVVDDFSARRAAFQAHRHDFTIYTIDSFAFDVGKGVDGEIVLVVDESQGADGIVARAGISKASDLKGKSVAYTRGSPAHYLLVTFLREGSLGIGDIRTVEVDDPTRAAEAFMSGKVDAAVTWEPYLTQIKAKRQGHVLSDTKTRPGLIVDVLVASREVVRDRPDLVRRVVKGWLRATDETIHPRPDTYRIMADGLGMKESDFKAAASGLIFADPSRNEFWLKRKGRDPSRGQRLFEDAAAVWRSEGLSDAPRLGVRYVNASFIPTASTPQ